jgi:hypothetical protein
VVEAEVAVREIVALHREFERWLGTGEGDFARFEAAFDTGFVMVMPDGRRLDRQAVLDFLGGGRGTRAGLRIAVEEVAPVLHAPPIVLMHYVERQWTGAGITARRSAALFRVTGGAAQWLFVQETWIA